MQSQFTAMKTTIILYGYAISGSSSSSSCNNNNTTSIWQLLKLILPLYSTQRQSCIPYFTAAEHNSSVELSKFKWNFIIPILFLITQLAVQFVRVCVCVCFWLQPELLKCLLFYSSINAAYPQGIYCIKFKLKFDEWNSNTFVNDMPLAFAYLLISIELL